MPYRVRPTGVRLCLLQHRQDVAGGILEPGDVRAAVLRQAAHHALLVLGHPLGALELPPGGAQPGEGRVDVIDLEVEDRVVGGGVVGLAVDERVAALGVVQREQGVLLVEHLDADAERLAIELAGLGDVVDGEAAECLVVGEHEWSSLVDVFKKTTRRPGTHRWRQLASTARRSSAGAMLWLTEKTLSGS